MLKDLNAVWIARSNRFLKNLEVPFNHVSIGMKWQAATLKREEVVTLCMIVSDGSTFPFLLGLLHLRICSVGVLMACEVNVVRVSDCQIAHCISEAFTICRHFAHLKLLREDIHPKNLCWLFGIALLAHYTLGSRLFLHRSSGQLFEIDTFLLLSFHLSHYLLSLLES